MRRAEQLLQFVKLARNGGRAALFCVKFVHHKRICMGPNIYARAVCGLTHCSPSHCAIGGRWSMVECCRMPLGRQLSFIAFCGQLT